MKFVSPSSPSAKIKSVNYYTLNETAKHIKCSMLTTLGLVIKTLQNRIILRKWEHLKNMTEEELLAKVLGNFMVFVH